MIQVTNSQTIILEYDFLGASFLLDLPSLMRRMDVLFGGVSNVENSEVVEVQKNVISAHLSIDSRRPGMFWTPLPDKVVLLEDMRAYCPRISKLILIAINNERKNL